MKGPSARSERPTALLVAYEGTDFAGWQLQPDQPTVQGELQKALATIHNARRETMSMVGSGRTDAGVHARGQVVGYYAPNVREPRRLQRSLNTLLPKSIRVLAVASMPAAFHPCLSASGKIYRYRIINRRILLPDETRWAWHLWGPLDLDALRDAADRLTGTHDYAAFTTSGGKSVTTVRTLQRIEIHNRGSEQIEIDFEADGFLYRMARNMMGVLAEVALGRRESAQVDSILNSRERACAGITAPAHGLCLLRVLYPPELVAPWVVDQGGPIA